jgi:hypothetical protein
MKQLGEFHIIHGTIRSAIHIYDSECQFFVLLIRNAGVI